MTKREAMIREDSNSRISGVKLRYRRIAKRVKERIKRILLSTISLRCKFSSLFSGAYGSLFKIVLGGQDDGHEITHPHR